MSRPIRMAFMGPRQARIIFTSSLYRLKTYSYILVRVGEKYNHYLRLHNGIIEVVRLGSESETVRDMKPYNKVDIKHAARVYRDSYLPKTDEAKQILKEILANKDDDRRNFIFDEGPDKKSKLEKPTKAERAQVKANMVTLEKICEDLDLVPSRVRSAFRRHDIKKPGHGWTWPKSEYSQVVKMVKQLFA